jgi:hypothetical protein
MDIRRAVFIVVLLLVPVAAHADRHFADLMAGGFKAKGSDYDGVQFSGSWPIDPCIDLSLVGSFGRYHGKESGDPADHTLATYIVGARFTHHKLFGLEVFPFYQLMRGAVDNIREIPGEGDRRQVKTHQLWVLGAGIQPKVKYWRTLLRLQVDVFHRSHEEMGAFNPGGWGYAGSVGVVYRFGPEFRCKPKKKKGTDQEKACAPSMPPPSARAGNRPVPAERSGPPAPGERIAVGRP